MTPLDRAPAVVRELVDDVVAALQRGHGDDLAIIVHGSIAFGSFVPGRSDLDVLAVVGSSDESAGQRTSAALATLSVPAACTGVELTTVSPADLHAGGPRWPFRYHATIDHRGYRYVPGTDIDGDADLTLHYAVARQHGWSILGPQPTTLLPEVPTAEIRAALVGELDWALGQPDVTYLVANAARALRFAEDGSLTSKIEGLRWARDRVPDPTVLDRALRAQMGDTAAPAPSDIQAARSFADMVRIHLCAVEGDRSS